MRAARLVQRNYRQVTAFKTWENISCFETMDKGLDAEQKSRMVEIPLACCRQENMENVTIPSLSQVQRLLPYLFLY